MSAYFFFDVRKVRDPDKLDQYKSGVFASVEKYGGRYLVLGGPFQVLEGDWSPTTPVIIQFPSPAKARAWYDSDEYRPLRALRIEATDSRGVLIDGPDHRTAG